MPPTKNGSRAESGRQRRHRQILELIGSHYVRSQGELCELLEERKCEVNQGTLSRDLRELGVIKGPDGYEMPPSTAATADHDLTHLAATVKQWLSDAIVAQNQVVLKTPPGGAQPLALSIDRVGIQPALGTIAGDDTILVICATNKDARRLAQDLEALR